MTESRKKDGVLVLKMVGELMSACSGMVLHGGIYTYWSESRLFGVLFLHKEQLLS